MFEKKKAVGLPHYKQDEEFSRLDTMLAEAEGELPALRSQLPGLMKQEEYARRAFEKNELYHLIKRISDADLQAARARYDEARKERGECEHRIEELDGRVAPLAEAKIEAGHRAKLAAWDAAITTLEADVKEYSEAFRALAVIAARADGHKKEVEAMFPRRGPTDEGHPIPGAGGLPQHLTLVLDKLLPEAQSGVGNGETVVEFWLKQTASCIAAMKAEYERITGQPVEA